MFEVGATTRFVAFHRMPTQPPPESERHPHDYRVEVVAERERLDERGMVCDLALVASTLAGVADRARDRDLAELCGAEEVTVEVLAGWVHEQIAFTLKGDGAERLSVRVWESDEAFGGIHERP
jgi:6-pyruvoyltetrahydropterin/6-carboxytetrahydropterin synthase